MLVIAVAGENLSVDMEASVGVGGIRAWRVAGVGVSAGMGVLQDLLKEAIHGAAAGKLVNNVWAGKHFLVRKFDFSIIHGDQHDKYRQLMKNKTPNQQVISKLLSITKTKGSKRSLELYAGPR